LTKDARYFCRVCGLEEEEPPWGEDDATPLWDICACCGAEHGYEDCQPSAARQYREQWLAKGAPWFLPKLKPEGWNLEEQLKNVAPQYR
jgi:hypothetical protein